MELVSEAIAFAVKAHDGMRRKKSEAPYILHPMEAAVIVGTMSDDQNLIAAAALHDVVEDAGITLDEIKEKFGQRVFELVGSETEDKRADLPPSDTWRIRKEESLAVLESTEDIGDVKNLVLDVKDVEYISSAGLRVLLAAQKKMQKIGSMKVTCVCEEVMEVFEMTGFADILVIE